MPPKGKSNNPLGKPKGTLAKSTVVGREAIAQFVDGNAERLIGWLDDIAEESPLQAFNAFMSVVEYHIPKLARQEHTGAGGGAIQQEIKQISLEHVVSEIRKDEA